MLNEIIERLKQGNWYIVNEYLLRREMNFLLNC